MCFYRCGNKAILGMNSKYRYTQQGIIKHVPDNFLESKYKLKS